MHGRRSCIQHPKEDFLVIMADLRLGNGKLLVAREADKIVGMAFTVMGDDTLYIKELLADTDAVQDTLLYEAAHIYKVQRMDYFYSIVCRYFVFGDGKSYPCRGVVEGFRP